VYRYADRDSICYMCLCDCTHTEIEGDPSCVDIKGKEEYCKGYYDYRADLSNWKMIATFLTVGVNYVAKSLTIKAQVDHARSVVACFVWDLQCGCLVIAASPSSAPTHAAQSKARYDHAHIPWQHALYEFRAFC
jgi:hypothetical protein